MAEPLRRIDHVVLAVQDLEAAAAFYAMLGFQVGARNRHPWGTENRLIQFGSAFIELITVENSSAAIPDHAPRHFSFGAFVRDYLREREGLAMVALDSIGAAADAKICEAAGIGAFEPFFFERKGTTPDGRESHVAFTLAFAEAAGTRGTGFFVCQQHFPQRFWSPALQCHDNGASDIAAITLQASRPNSCIDFFTAFAGSTVRLPESRGWEVPLRQGGHIKVVKAPDAVRPLVGQGITISVTDLATLRRRLDEAGVSWSASDEAVVIAASTAFGTELRFEPQEKGAA